MFPQQVRQGLTEIPLECVLNMGRERYRRREASSWEELNWFWEQPWSKEPTEVRGVKIDLLGVVVEGT